VKLVGQLGAVTQVVCPPEGGEVNVGTIAGSQFNGILTCPPRTALCTGNPCDSQFCSGHGVCNPTNGQCACDSRWYGSDAYTCNLQQCPTNNATGLMCSANATCNAASGVTGTCRGNCNANTGVCTCAAGYSGTACELKGCPTVGGLPCSGQGNCTAEGVCVCNPGFIGTSCSIRDCPSTGGGKCSGSSQGTCDSSNGVCSCVDAVAPGGGTTTYYTGVDCSVANNGSRPFTQLAFVGETTGGVPNEPVNVTLQSKQYQYFTFTAPTATYSIRVTLTPQSPGSVSVSTLALVAAYANVYRLPSVTASSQFTSSVSVSSGVASLVIDLEPPRVVGGVIQNSAFDHAGVINVAALSLGDNPVPVQVSLTRDGCAVLNCSHGGNCTNGACMCPRYTAVGGYDYGWAGSDCTSPDCPGTPDCGGRGECVVSNTTGLPVCQCNELYNGTACQTSVSGANTTAVLTDPTTLRPQSGVGFNAYNSLGYSPKSGVALIGQIVRTGLPVRGMQVAMFRFASSMAALVRLEVNDSSPLGDAVLLGRSNQPPSLTTYDSFDVTSWTSSSRVHTFAAVVPPGDYYISVMNSRYALSPLNFTLYYEFSTLCPPSLTNSSNITSPYSNPHAPAMPCSGHGDPAAFCSSNDSAALPPSSPVLCVCQPGWEGVYCDIPVTVVSAGVPFVVSGLAPGDWQYFVYIANSSTVQINVNAVRTSASLRSQPLVITGRASSRTAQSLASIFDSNLFDYKGYTAFNGNQSLRISRTSTLSVRPTVEYFYIGVHNTRNAKSTVDLSVTVTALSSFPARCPASGGAAAQASCLAAASTTVCGGNGQAILNAEDAEAVDCQCMTGWNRRSFCGSPQVFQTFGQFLTATQNIDFLCSLCNVELAALSQSVNFYRIPQPLQKATALTVSTNQSSAGANPSLMIAQYLPRSTADFVFVSSSTNLTQTIEIDSPSSTGSYWVAVYANNAGNFTLAASRRYVGGPGPSDPVRSCQCEG
jgi:hypothetical protein